MCRLLGIVANKEVDFHFSLFGNASRNLRTQSEENPDGWGIAVYPEEGSPKIKKEPLKAAEDLSFDQAAFSAFGRILVGHVRLASSGRNRHENTHPFEIGGWVFAHNGTIKAIDNLKRHIDPSFAMMVKGDTDSEKYFALILSQFLRDGVLSDAGKEALVESLSKGIKVVRDEIGGYGLNFILSDGRYLFGFKNGRPLYLLSRGPESVPGVNLQSEETGALLSWKKSVGEKAVIIASEKMTASDPWVPLKENELVSVDRNLKVVRNVVK
jgi:predicted glutamine amidotransferase